MKKLLVVLFFSAIFFSVVKSTSAAMKAGSFELRSTDGGKYFCYAYSQLMQNLSYKVLITCENILFPVDETIFSYQLWANPKDGTKAVKLGSIGLGIAEFNTKPEFTSLFITAEQNPNVKDPTGKVVMKGSVKPITFLEKPTQAEVTAAPGTTASPTQTPAQKTSIRDRLLTGLKRAGLASGLALIAILGLVFILTRPK